MYHWERVSESGYVDDGGLIDIRVFSHLQSDQIKMDIHTSGEGKGKGLDICYSATYMSRTR